ncbi:MAG: DUF6249 domain-containing protein [Bacteroidota bacterium]
MKDVVPIIAIISVFGSVILFVNTLTSYSLKKKLIDKDMVNPETTNLFQKQTNKHSALKWGLVVFFGGIGLIIIDVMSLDGDDAMPYGIEAVCIALGFLAYYGIIKKEVE